MIRIILAALALMTATPALSQIVTSASKLPDSNGDGRIVVSKAVTQPHAKKGTVLFDCGSKVAPFVYAVGSLDKCPAQIETVSGTSSKAKADTLYGTNGVIPVYACRPVKVVGAYRLIETYSNSTYRNITCSGIVGEGIKREGIRLRGKVENVTIQNFRLIHEDARNVSPHLPGGIHVEKGANVVVRNGVASGFRMIVPKGSYENGDGIATELNTTGTITNVTASDNSDGGFDLKGQWRLDQLRAVRNGRGFRFWQQVTAGTLITQDNRTAVWVAKSGEATIDKLIAIGGGLLIETEAGAHLTIKSCDLSLWTGTEKVKGNGTVKLGAGCVMH